MTLPTATSSRGSGPSARVSGYRNAAARSAVRSTRGPVALACGRTPVSAYRSPIATASAQKMARQSAPNQRTNAAVTSTAAKTSQMARSSSSTLR